MHTCPFCGEECDCDMDDTGGLPVPKDCPHICDDPVDEEQGESEYEEFYPTDLEPACTYCSSTYGGGYCWQSPDGNHHMSNY